jgi:mxaL protein
MVDDGVAAPPLPGVTPGHEHLSSLREAYLRLLAGETGLRYQRLRDARALAEALLDDAMARARDVRIDLRPWLGGVALVALLIGLGIPGLVARKHQRSVIASSNRP